jgi:hypothetical protein
MVDLFTADLNGLTNPARYSAIADFARAQPAESNRHDFKTIWNNDAVKDVAAFANTFGGILIIGARKGRGDTEVELVGVTSTSELTTGIASAIATNISPTPSYDIVECHRPGDTNIRFCVIRVRGEATLHLVTKKGIHTPVWIRNADQTIWADAAQLRMMIDRERQSAEVKQDSFLAKSHRMFQDMTIAASWQAELEHWPSGTFQQEQTYFKLALIPVGTKTLTLDVRNERDFVTLIHEHYRRVRSCLSSGPSAAEAVNRSDEYYEYRWYHKHLDYEARWRITNHLDIAHATQIRQGSEWSLVDVVGYSILMLSVGARWWESLNYYGDGMLIADIDVQGLRLSRGKSNQFTKLFGPVAAESGLRAEILNEHAIQRHQSNAQVHVDFASMRDNISALVTALMNSLLRGLGHGVVRDEFAENVRVVMSGSAS